MERRYLAATAVLAITFLGFSQALRTDVASQLLQPRPTLMSDLKCATRALGAKLLSKISPSLNPDDLAQMKLLAQLNLSRIFGVDNADAQPKAAPAAVRVEVAKITFDCPETRKLQQKALRSAQRGQRNDVKVQKTKSKLTIPIDVADVYPADFEIPSAEEINRQVQMSVMAAQREVAAAQAVQARVVAENLSKMKIELANMKLPEVAVTPVGAVSLQRSPACARSLKVQTGYNRVIQRAYSYTEKLPRPPESNPISF